MNPTPENHDDTQSVLEANREFYRALESLEIERMPEVWHQDDGATCVHPGWPMLSGWCRIRESWERIFNNTGSFQVRLSDVNVRIEKATAWVTCIEKILHLSSSGVSGGVAACTNIYLRTPLGWKITLHHASTIPDEKQAP